MKLLTSTYLSTFVLSSFLAVVTMTTPASTHNSTITATTSTITTAKASSGTTKSANTSSTTVASTTSTSQTDGSTSTNNTTQSSTIATTQSPVSCKNGTCSGNECMKNITETCTLKESESCYQIVSTNGTDTYEVGCKANCTYQTDDAMTTRCCTGDLCNKVLLSDPTESTTVKPGNDGNAVRSSRSVVAFALSLLVRSIFT